jgi:hypothetical protein
LKAVSASASALAFAPYPLSALDLASSFASALLVQILLYAQTATIRNGCTEQEKTHRSARRFEYIAYIYLSRLYI